MSEAVTERRSLRFDKALWLMPAAYVVHIGDEWFGGFPDYVVRYMGGRPMPPGLFFLNNALFMAVLLALCAWASRSRSKAAAVALMAWASGNLFWNFFVHLGYTVATGHYSPGLVTSSLLYYPLPLIVGVLGLREKRLTPGGLIGAFAIGAALMFLVIWAGVYRFKL